MVTNIHAVSAKVEAATISDRAVAQRPPSVRM
jgi:hypothetical protein